ncbi:putative periplasmic lipoprotein [Anaerocellum danielii]|uniref:DUF3298 domain-containing protein n=1 Tax=Anaerocellum danielii TaxID=1387557 RepID=A0ABZ0U2H2_9FIRM|nr:hypothetical protein [Caldicellulosiruptor danielii]WPX09496.1 hypothetical protein SOJ16_000708 [Caldicellulosiruptor danielii]
MKRLNKTIILKITIVAITCLLLSGCSLFGKSKKENVLSVQSTGQVVYNEKSVISPKDESKSERQVEKVVKVDKKTIDQSKSNKIIKIEYPVIAESSYPQSAIEKVNETIEQFIKNKLEEVQKTGDNFVLGITYEYHYYKLKDIFSTIFFIDGGGSGGYYESMTFNFNLNDGELLPREDIVNSNALKKLRSYITFLSATCKDIELKTPKYQESLNQAIENTDIQIDDKFIIKDDGIEVYFPSFDIDPNGKKSANFYIKFDELNKNVIKKIDIQSLSELEKLTRMELKDIKSNFGLCDITYLWEGVVYYNIGAIEWPFNPEDGYYEDADSKIPNAVLFREGATILGVEIGKMTPEQAYEILKENKTGAIREVTKGQGPDSDEVIFCELSNGISIYFECGRKSIDSNELVVVDAIVKRN